MLLLFGRKVFENFNFSLFSGIKSTKKWKNFTPMPLIGPMLLLIFENLWAYALIQDYAFIRTLRVWYNTEFLKNFNFHCYANAIHVHRFHNNQILANWFNAGKILHWNMNIGIRCIMAMAIALILIKPIHHFKKIYLQ